MKMASSRKDKLLGPAATMPAPLIPASTLPEMPDMEESTRKKLMERYAPKNDEQFKEVLLAWLKSFH